MSHQEAIQAELKSLDFRYGQLTSVAPFRVPDHYFHDLPGSILALIHAESETDLIVQHFTRNMPYSVSGNYFNTLPDQLLIHLSGQSDPELTALLNKPEMRQSPYAVPKHYFEDLEQQLLIKIQDNAVLETESLSPLVAGLRDKPTFEVPSAYFDKPRAKILTFTRTAEQSIKWTRWAAAAAIIFIFSLGGWNFLNTSGTINPKANVQQVLAQIPDADIQEYLNYTLDDSEVFALAKNVSAPRPAFNQKMFEGISDQEIKDYLEYNVY